MRNSVKIDVNLLKALIREFAAKVGIKLLNAKNGYDLLLANSEDEIRCVRKYCRLKVGAKLSAVPNAIDPIPEWVSSLTLYDELPSEDYILVPGYFAERKNQKSLIMALKDFNYSVVFMGRGPLFEKCRQIASPNMIFLGHVEHQSRLFYSALKFARIVCLPSNCETPGIAGLEAAALGVRPVVPYEGGTCQYYGWDAEYINPLSQSSIRDAVERAWTRGRLRVDEADRYRRRTWSECAQRTLKAYGDIIKSMGLYA